jgi:hypothetical protein
VLGVFAGQLAAREWRAAEEATTRLEDGALVRVHESAVAARARAMAECYQFASIALLTVSLAVALYAIAPGLPTEGIAGLALAGAIYLIADALISVRAEYRSIADDELFNDFSVRAKLLDRDTALTEFALERPSVARRSKRRGAD